MSSGGRCGLSFSLTGRSSTRGPCTAEQHSLLSPLKTCRKKRWIMLMSNSKMAILRAILKQICLSVCHLSSRCWCRGKRVSSPHPHHLPAEWHQCSLLHPYSTGWTCRWGEGTWQEQKTTRRSPDLKKPCDTYRAQVGSVYSILGFPTTISRALARVTATLNLWTRKERLRTMLCAGVCRHSARAWVCVVYLLILDEAEVELLVYLCVIGAAANCRHYYHSLLLTLELLHWTNLTHTHTQVRQCFCCMSHDIHIWNIYLPSGCSCP